MGTLSSFVMKVGYDNCLGNSIEWVIENRELMEKYSPDRAVFPSSPGAYLLTITSLPDIPQSIPGKFVIEPILNGALA
jgi:hypothetical protein